MLVKTRFDNVTQKILSLN